MLLAASRVSCSIPQSPLQTGNVKALHDCQPQHMPKRFCDGSMATVIVKKLTLVHMRIHLYYIHHTCTLQHCRQSRCTGALTKEIHNICHTYTVKRFREKRKGRRTKQEQQ